MNSVKIYIVGYGNLGQHLKDYFCENNLNFGGIFTDQDIEIKGIDFYRKSEIKSILKKDDILFITTKDDEISNVIHQVGHSDVVKIYCSGSVSLNSLNDIPNCGVWYPLYSFSKNARVAWEKVPVFLEYSNQHVFEILKDICDQLKKEFHVLDSIQRKQLHLAAVFANNFVNACLIGANEVLKGNESLKFEFLLPIIQQTIDKISDGNPLESQTGPAKRNDSSTMADHIQLLTDSPAEHDLYLAISKYIQQKIHYAP